MSKSSDIDLLELATPYALDAVSEAERVDTERRVAAAPAPVAEAFRTEVRGVREAMAVVSATTQIEPPAELRERVLAAVAAAPLQSRWRAAILAAAVVLAIAVIAVGVALALRPSTLPSIQDQVFTASDKQTAVPERSPARGGTTTLIYSREKNAAILVMDDVPPPNPGTVYQVWLLADQQQPKSVATMDAEAVSPHTEAVLPDIGDSSAVALTEEPGSGSEQPTRAPFAELRIT